MHLSQAAREATSLHVIIRPLSTKTSVFLAHEGHTHTHTPPHTPTCTRTHRYLPSSAFSDKMLARQCQDEADVQPRYAHTFGSELGMLPV